MADPTISVRDVTLQAPPPLPAGQAGGRQAGAESPTDQVDLKSGAFYRGTIIEFVPGSHLLIRILSGEIKRIPAADLASVLQGGEAIPLAPLTSSENPVDPSAPEGELGQILAGIPGKRVHLNIRSNRRAVLQRRISDEMGETAASYYLVCKLPCHVTLPVDDPEPYRIGGSLLQPTPWFPLPKEDSEVSAEMVNRGWEIVTPGGVAASAISGATGGIISALHYGADVGGDGMQSTGYVFSGLSGLLFLSSAAVWFLKPESRLLLEKGKRPLTDARQTRRSDQSRTLFNIGIAGAWGGGQEGHLEVAPNLEFSYGWGPGDIFYSGPYVRGGYWHSDETPGGRNGSVSAGLGIGLWKKSVRDNVEGAVGALIGYDRRFGSYYEDLAENRLEIGARAALNIIDVGLGTEVQYTSSIDPQDPESERINRLLMLWGFSF